MGVCMGLFRGVMVYNVCIGGVDGVFGCILGVLWLVNGVCMGCLGVFG